MRASYCTVILATLSASAPADEPKFAVEQKPGRAVITRGRQAVATYVYQDEKILRPYFAHLHGPDGVQVTRNHPPIQGKDPADHATMHPGLWLAFGDISGSDFWRNRAVVKHDRFVSPAAVREGVVTFAVRNRYVGKGGKCVCEETSRYSLRARLGGVLLIWDSTFTSDAGDFVFGDQEEMGLGVRVATPISVRKGGRITASHGGQNERGTWGKAAKWCDYSGLIGGRHAGVTLMPDPANFRPCWFHNRDYGVMVANPFGRKAMRKGPKSAIRVAKGKTLRLRFGVLLHAADAGKKTDIQAAYEDFLRELPPRGGKADRAQRPARKRRSRAPDSLTGQEPAEAGCPPARGPRVSAAGREKSVRRRKTLAQRLCKESKG